MNQQTSSVVPTRWERFKQSDILYYFLRDKVAMVSFAVFMAFFGRYFIAVDRTNRSV